MKHKLYESIAHAISGYQYCLLQSMKDNTTANRYADRAIEWKNSIIQITNDHLPSGSGFDEGCEVDLMRSNMSKLVIHTQFHHMDDNGMYDGWTSHIVTIRPTFIGLVIKVSGVNKNNIKGYIADNFYELESKEVEV